MAFTLNKAELAYRNQICNELGQGEGMEVERSKHIKPARGNNKT